MSSKGRETSQAQLRERSPVTPGFHIMAKPIGPVCNLRCRYCFYLEKEALFPQDEDYRMSYEVLESYTRSYINSQPVPELTFAWQGGEPMLLGIDFFQRAVEAQARYAGDKRIINTIQTNGTLLTDDWCEFMARNRFLVGLSIDGPEDIHDHHRIDRAGKPTFQNVMRGLELLRKHRVEFNVLTCVTRESAKRPLDIYHFLKEHGVQYIQFIPIIERKPDSVADVLGLNLAGPPALDREDAQQAVMPWTVEPDAYGDFLIQIFDEWVRNDVGSVFIMIFEWALSSWMGTIPPACIFSPRCGRCVIIEHNGDLYSCDHYMYPSYRLGNILNDDLSRAINSPRQIAFGSAKEKTLPKYCHECKVLRACHGACPKHRFMMTPDGEPGLNYLCPSYKNFFMHIAPYLRWMARLIRSGEQASKIMELGVFSNHRPAAGRK